MRCSCAILWIRPVVLAGLPFLPLACVAQLPNAWQMTDNSTAVGGTLGYTNQLSASHITAATNAGFRLTVNARFVMDLGTRTMNMSYALGNRRLLVWWDLDSNDDLTAELEGGSTYTLTTNGAGSALYHTHEIIYDPSTQRASYVFDGVVKTNNWQSSANPLAVAGRIRWGAGSEPGQGQINYHSVNFSITGLGSVASYDAGTAGSPPLAPDPETQGWRLLPDSPPDDIAVTNISPDTALLPEATTLAADLFTLSTARLNGQANAHGSPALAWFEWGTSTNYGNATLPQAAGSTITNKPVSDGIGGLVIGTNYFFRLVASNTFGIAAGANQTFNLASLRPTVSTLAADQLTNTSARLNGEVNPQSWPTVAWFEWGTNTSYGNATALQNLGSGGANVAVSEMIAGLVGGLNYHFRLVASNAFGLRAGANRSFNVSVR